MALAAAVLSAAAAAGSARVGTVVSLPDAGVVRPAALPGPGGGYRSFEHALAAAAPPGPTCPDDVLRVVNMTGHTPVTLFGAKGDGKADDSYAVRAAIAAATGGCGGTIFFPPGNYYFASTVVLAGDKDFPFGKAPVVFKGAASTGALMQFGQPPQAFITCDSGPAFQIGSDDSGDSPGNYERTVVFHDLTLVGNTSALLIMNAEGVYARNVDFASQHRDPADDCGASTVGWKAGSNVVLGSRNAAVVVENTFWVWFERCVFQYHGPSAGCNDQRPSVILRGNERHKKDDVHTAYLVRFDNCMFNGGGVQYQQTAPPDQTMGQIVIQGATVENSATPLLDFQSDPATAGGNRDQNIWGLQNVIIADIRMDDRVRCRWAADGCMGKAGYPTTVPIVALNCTQPNCTLDGVQLTSTSNWGGPGVKVYNGFVRQVTIMTSQSSGATDVIDANDKPIGYWASRNMGGGWTMVGPDAAARHPCPLPAVAGKGCDATAGQIAQNNATLYHDALTAGTMHTLVLGVSGERHARMAIDADGSVHYGQGGDAPFDTTVTRHVANTSVWAPGAVPPGAGAVWAMPLVGAAAGDVCHASHDRIGLTDTLILTATAGAGKAAAKLFNFGEVAVSVPKGTLRIACNKYN